MRSFLLQSLFRLLGLLPLRIAHALGAAAGWLLGAVANRRQCTARKNLELCFPDMRTDARECLLRRNLRELGKSVFEIGALWTRGRRCVQTLVRHAHGADQLQCAVQRGKGVIIAAPHLGAWELVGLYCSMHHPMTSLYRTSTSSTCDIVRHARERFGATLVPTDNHGIRALYKALERGELVGILPDQVPAQQSGSIFAPFFGIPASTMVLLSRLALKTGAAVVFTYAERLPHGAGYDMHFLLAPDDISQGSLEESVTIMNRMVEQCARARPEQYQWFYKRFRVRPPGEPGFY